MRRLPQRLQPDPNVVRRRRDEKDPKQPGLWTRTSSRTARTQHVREDELTTYRVVYKRRSDRKTRQMTLGKASQLTLAEARRRAKAIMGQVAEGKDPAAQHDEWTSASTFEELAIQWLAFKVRQGRAKSYTDEARRRLGAMPDWFRSKKACDIQRVDVARVLDARANTGKRTETNRVQAMLSAVFKWAMSEGHIPADPSQGLKRRFDESARQRVLSPEELRAIWHGIGEMKGSPSSKLALQLCFVLGQRPKEIVAIRRDDIQLDGGQPHLIIRSQSAKNNVEHWVPLPNLAVEIFQEAIALSGNSDWLFPNPKNTGSITPKSLTKVINRTRTAEDGKLFGVPDAQLYDAKKTIATFLGDAGYPNELIGVLFNHVSAKSGSVTGRHYNHSSYMGVKRQLIELWCDHLITVVRVA